ncbi:MAG: hypothetical protein AAGI08_11340 [Bacteroidota bacterium]
MVRFFFLALALFVAGCDSGDTTDSDNDGGDDDDDGGEFVFPYLLRVDFDPDVEFVYLATFTVTDSLGNVIVSDQDSIRVRATMEPEAIAGFNDAFRLTARADAGGETIVWYREANDELTELAAQDIFATPPAFPKRPVATQSWRAGAQTDGPRLVYRYPLVEGRDWPMVTDPVQTLTRYILTAKMDVEVPAGTFTCAEIRTNDEAERENVWFDYIGEVGLVRRDLRSTATAYDEAGLPVGTLTTQQEIVLARVAR